MNFFERSEIFAALDLGTTNCRLLIARPSGDGLRVIDSFSRIVRLGEGLDASGVLSEAAMERTIEALAVCAGKIRQRNVTRARLVATEACRRAGNCQEFLTRVRGATGLDLEIIANHEEARLALAGCVPLIDPRDPHAIVFDIGGGSTEIVWAAVQPPQRRSGPATTEIRGILSIPFGVVSLTERYASSPSDAATYARMVDEVCRQFQVFDQHWDIRSQVAAGGVQMLGSSGTVTTLAGIQLRLSRYERSRVDGILLSFEQIARVSRDLVAMDGTGRAAQPCIGPARADLMIAGCAILEAICRTWPVGRLRVADRGVREGILAGLRLAAREDQAASAACLPPTPLPT